MAVPFVLASRSPARLATLRAAGVQPQVEVSGVDEDAILAHAREAYATSVAAGLAAGSSASAAAEAATLPLADQPFILARAKAEEIVSRVNPDAIVLGCDSMLEFDGEILGKPYDAATATERWRAMRGRSGILHTGHALLDNRHATRVSAQPTLAGDTSSTVVHFADLTDAEIDAYVATGEPLEVAGAFTVDGLGGPYVERIEGDFHGVVGVSLPLLRVLLRTLGVDFHDLR